MAAYKKKKKKIKRTQEPNEEGQKEVSVFPTVHWFPGHMAKATRMIKGYISKVDVVIELLDARIPKSSSNPVLTELIGQKPHIVVLNKSDLADPVMTKAWKENFQKEGMTVIDITSTTSRGIKALVRAVEVLSKPVIDKWLAKGIKARPIRTMILGIPNVGKSTLINTLAGTAATRTANKAGYTRGQQWVHIGKNIELLDTPGILWPKLEDQTGAAKLAMTGAIADDVVDLESIATQLISAIVMTDKTRLEERYKFTLSQEDTVDTILTMIGKKRGCLVSGGLIDMDKARRVLMTDYRDGRLGRLTLDAVEG
ncbi:MAG: ribosome biogenesis GTPase YlqF [Veillonellaceae bacterium]|nr:ribosome biogenesis GTPase YlqF [Veillonellaceae bacterium]